MTNSLRDQLMKAGLVSKTAKQPSKKRGNKQQQRKARKQQGDQRQAELAALDAHKKERDRVLNEQREKQRKAREQAEWVRQLIQSHAVAKTPATDDDTAFHFTLDGKIHHLYVGAKQRGQLSQRQLGIVSFDGQYHFMPRQIIQRLQDKVPRRCWLAEADSSQVDTDDPYAEFQVPDDLMW